VENGWVKLWRKTIDSRVFQNDGLLKVWIWCLLKANHKEKWVSIKTGKGSTEIKIGKGQFVFGRKSASKELKMKPSTVRDRMQKLRDMQNIDTQPDTHYTVISIKNWDTYQSQEVIPDTQPDRQPTGNRQATDTNKKVKKGKKVKKKNKYRDCVLFLDDEYQKLLEKLGQEKLDRGIEILNNYIMSNGKKYKSHYHVFQNWVIGRVDQEYGIKGTNSGTSDTFWDDVRETD